MTTDPIPESIGRHGITLRMVRPGSISGAAPAACRTNASQGTRLAVRRRERPSCRRVNRAAGKLPVLVHGVERHVAAEPPVLAAPPRVASASRRDRLADLHDRVLGVQATPHPFDDQGAREIQQVQLADAGRAGRADLIVEKQAGPQDRRIADATGNLP